MKCPRLSNPDEVVEFIWEDKGSTLPWYDLNGNQFEAYVSIFTIRQPEIKRAYAVLDKEMVDRGEIDRFKNDCEVAAGLDLDLTRCERIYA